MCTFIKRRINSDNYWRIYILPQLSHPLNMVSGKTIDTLSMLWSCEVHMGCGVLSTSIYIQMYSTGGCGVNVYELSQLLFVFFYHSNHLPTLQNPG